MNADIETTRAADAIAKASGELAGRCQQLLPDERVVGATGAMQGPNPVLRILALAVAALGLLLPVPRPVALVAIPVFAAAIWCITSVWWKRCAIVATDSELVVFAVAAGRLPSTVLARSPIGPPARTKDSWRGYDIDGNTYWISKHAAGPFAVPIA